MSVLGFSLFSSTCCPNVDFVASGSDESWFPCSQNVASSLSVSLKSDTNSPFSSSSVCDLQKQDCFLHTLPSPPLPPPGSSSGSACLSDLGRPGAAVSPQQQNASQLPPNAKLRQRTPANMKTVLRKKKERESTFFQLSSTVV